MSEKRDYKLLLMMLIVLNGLDLATTIIGLELYGLTEMNPLFSLEAKTLVLKILLPIIFAYFFITCWKHLEKHNFKQGKAFLLLMLVGLNMFYIAVVMNNLVWLVYCIMQKLTVML